MTTPGEFGELHDPFAPETVRVTMSDGTEKIDVAATMSNHLEAPLPEVDASQMRPGDRIKIEFDDQQSQTYEVDGIDVGSLRYGSEDLINADTKLVRLDDEGNHISDAVSVGSALVPNGNFFTPGTIRVGSYLLVGPNITAATIDGFDLQRPNEDGTFRPVRLNQEGSSEPSSQVAHALEVFARTEDRLKATGFDFGFIPEGDWSHGSFLRVVGNLFVNAARQGFGCGVIDQDEIHTYDAGHGVLRAMRTIPAKGIFQVGYAEGVTKDIFQRVAGGGWTVVKEDGVTREIPDWRKNYSLDSPGFSYLADYVPTTSFTWLTPGQAEPIIHIEEAGERLGDVCEYEVEDLKMVLDRKHMVANPTTAKPKFHMGGTDYRRLVVDIYPGQDPKLVQERIPNPVDQRIIDGLSFSRSGNTGHLMLEGFDIPVNLDFHDHLEQLDKVVRIALGKSPRSLGHKLLSKLDLNK